MGNWEEIKEIHDGLEPVCQITDGYMLCKHKYVSKHNGICIAKTGYPYPNTPKSNYEMFADLIKEISGVSRSIEFYANRWNLVKSFLSMYISMDTILITDDILKDFLTINLDDLLCVLDKLSLRDNLVHNSIVESNKGCVYKLPFIDTEMQGYYVSNPYYLKEGIKFDLINSLRPNGSYGGFRQRLRYMITNNISCLVFTRHAISEEKFVTYTDESKNIVNLVSDKLEEVIDINYEEIVTFFKYVIETKRGGGYVTHLACALNLDSKQEILDFIEERFSSYTLADIKQLATPLVSQCLNNRYSSIDFLGIIRYFKASDEDNFSLLSYTEDMYKAMESNRYNIIFLIKACLHSSVNKDFDYLLQDRLTYDILNESIRNFFNRLINCFDGDYDYETKTFDLDFYELIDGFNVVEFYNKIPEFHQGLISHVFYLEPTSMDANSVSWDFHKCFDSKLANMAYSLMVGVDTYYREQQVDILRDYEEILYDSSIVELMNYLWSGNSTDFVKSIIFDSKIHAQRKKVLIDNIVSMQNDFFWYYSAIPDEFTNAFGKINEFGKLLLTTVDITADPFMLFCMFVDDTKIYSTSRHFVKSYNIMMRDTQKRQYKIELSEAAFEEIRGFVVYDFLRSMLSHKDMQQQRVKYITLDNLVVNFNVETQHVEIKYPLLEEEK